MSDLSLLEKAIAALESKRPLLGDEVVSLSIAVLKEKYENNGNSMVNGILPAEKNKAQRKQVTILFARITRAADSPVNLPDTSQLAVMNALWRRLDEAITSHGGIVDKHIGNAVMGVFGVPTVHEDDPERAVRAALAMRAALSNFASDVSFGMDISASGGVVYEHLKYLQLRIGINTGPVMLGEVGTSDEYTVIGDAVNVASRLERTAKPGSILISQETCHLVQGIFQVEDLGPVTIRGKSEPLSVYLVLGAKPRAFYTTGRGVEGVETRMVGRDKELYQLQVALQTAVHTRQGQLITIMGDAGVGKSRLVHEFNKWIKNQEMSVAVFKGRSDSRLFQMPYGLIRDLVTTQFDIQDTDSPTAVEQKIVKGMSQYFDMAEQDIRARARAVAQLLGLAMSEEGINYLLPTQIIDKAYDYVADYFQAVIARVDAAILFLEDLHWADDSSYDVIEHLAQLCKRLPLLIVCVTRPQQTQTRTWLLPETADTVPFPHTFMQLTPLSIEDSRKLVLDILQKLPSIPKDLSDMIVTRAEGNPYFVEELIKVLIEDGTILVGEKEWRIQRSQLTRLRVPLTLNGVLQARLDRLSELERLTLQRAAVIGRVFWDSAVIHMNELADEPLHSSETISALHALEKRELIFPRQNSFIAGAQAYIFKHAMLREVAYESVLLRQRPAYHKQIADWLATKSGERVAEYASIIAEHYEQAGENVLAAELYEMAAQRAADMYNVDVAIDYYGKALSLLTEKMHEVSWQLRIQERLGKLLMQRSRLVEAAQTYMTMRYTAEIDGDLTLQAHAWNGLAAIQQEQGDYQAALTSAAKAEHVAWLVSANDELAQALIYKSRAQQHMEKLPKAVENAQQALEVSRKVDDRRIMGEALSLLCAISLEDGHLAEAEGYFNQMVDLLREMQSKDIDRKEIAYFETMLGSLSIELGKFAECQKYFLAALRLYREIDYQLAVGNTLNLLGEAARLRGEPKKALTYFREAVQIAEAIGDQLGMLYYRTNYGAALVAVGSSETAVSELQTVIEQAKNISRVVNWMGLLEAYCYLALAFFSRREMEMALNWLKFAATLVFKGQGSAKSRGLFWRAAGLVAAGLADNGKTLVLNNKQYTPKACFLESWQQVRLLYGDERIPAREKALTLWAWGKYMSRFEDEEIGRKLQIQAQKMAQKLGITLTTFLQ
ncbi:MAG: adenylate/guanylate cyclase domain-containing protein [Candidatus Promineifilaceae bacterium]